MTAVAPRPARVSRVPARPRASRPRRTLWDTASPLLVSILAAALAVAVYVIFIRTPLGQLADTAAMRGNDVDHPRVTEVLTRTLNATQLASLALVCLLAAAFGALRRRLDLSVAATLTVVGANLTAQLLKARLDRPDLDDFPAPNSFPSGHTAAAASVAFVLVLVFPRALRGTIALIGAAYTAVVAIATVWAEWHRPSDAVAGVLIVLAWGSLAVWGVRLRLSGPTRPLHLPNRLVTVVLGITAAITAAAGVVGLVAVALSERVFPDFVSGKYAFLAGAAGIVAFVAGAFIIWVRLTAGEPPASRPATGGTR
ncbi:phosphatase PAP2 family protein [Actinoplanes sp. NPDC051861]|uniref:phosphatase PAP2 family protein n=1 Tax=Actinoplanes sp. NPDC051861 TaxID=3155170 RepID=UPI003417CC51